MNPTDPISQLLVLWAASLAIGLGWVYAHARLSGMLKDHREIRQARKHRKANNKGGARE